MGVAVVAIVLIGVLIFAPSSYFNRMGTISDYEEDNSAKHRIIAWKAGFQMALDHPLGVGAGNFNAVYGRFYRDKFVDESIFAAGRWISPHSLYVQCMAEIGFLGLILMLVLLGVNFRDTIRMKNFLKEKTENPKALFLPKALAASVLAFSINALTLGVFYYPHFYVLSGFIVISNHFITTKTDQYLEFVEGEKGDD